jgi:hypothetical protein
VTRNDDGLFLVKCLKGAEMPGLLLRNDGVFDLVLWLDLGVLQIRLIEEVSAGVESDGQPGIL